MTNLGDKVYDYRHTLYWCAAMLTILVVLRVLSMAGVGS